MNRLSFKVSILLLILALPLVLCAQAKRNANLPALSTNVAELLPAAAVEKNHVLFVNVGNAMPANDFSNAVAYVRSQWWVNVALAEKEKPFAGDVVADTAFLKTTFGEKAKVVVAIVKNKTAPRYIAIPGLFAQVNIQFLEDDSPAPEYLKKRQTQMVISGLARALGIGVNVDQYCAMFYDTQTLEGLDKVSATFGPYAYVPFQNLLLSLGGEEIFSFDE